MKKDNNVSVFYYEDSSVGDISACRNNFKIAVHVYILSKKRKFTHTLFSNISKNAYPRKINFSSN